MINSERYAAIDIGSNAVRLLLCEAFETDSGPYFRKISLIRMPIRLGSDAFIRGKITQKKIDHLTRTIQGFRHLISAYEPLEFQACATSAMREATNGKAITKRIRKETGVDIRIISGKEEARTIFANNPMGHLADGHAWLFIDVGGGSTEITIHANGKSFARSFGIGTIRLLEDLVDKSLWKAMKRWVREHTGRYATIEAIGSGGNINKIIKLAKCTDGRSIPLNEMKNVQRYLKFFSFEERITKLGLKPDRADVIMPALKIYLAVMKWGGVSAISVPQIGLADGLVRLMYRKRNHPPET
jgi:exopolyphosphatase / guanosine-5'-triphosphate,3'-diphosphate pyrophosphatase